jgi:hypothetical protein
VQKPWEDVTLLEILEREIAEARAARRRDRKQQRELEDARLIRLGLLPTTVPQIAGVQLAVTWQPANGVGGDCFDTLTFGQTLRHAKGRQAAGPPGNRPSLSPDVRPAPPSDHRRPAGSAKTRRNMHHVDARLQDWELQGERRWSRTCSALAWLGSVRWRARASVNQSLRAYTRRAQRNLTPSGLRDHCVR